MKKVFIQQGDVLIQSSKIPKEAKRRRGRAVLAEGEHTGHAHVAEGADVELYEKDGVLYVHCPNGCEVTHQEHNRVTLPAGDYTIGRVQEYDHFAEEARNVAD